MGADISGVIPALPPPLPDFKAEHLAMRQHLLDQQLDLPPQDAQRLQTLLVEIASRKVDGLSLYEPLPVQASFHASHCRVRVLRGSNRGGKTLPAAVEVARALTGEDPFFKFPLTGGRCYAVGKNLDHIGQVMWPKLAKPGAFRMVRDFDTDRWRALRPWEVSDELRRNTAKPVPPLIPDRLITDIAWESKSEGIPSVVRLINGWEIAFYSSLGRPPQGSDLDLVWLDEEIVDQEWFPEMSARLLDRSGRLIWSATPQAGTDQLYELHERAEKDRNLIPNLRRVEEFVILLADNPHMLEADKKALAADLSEDDAKVRIGGDFALLSSKIYPHFSMHRHGIDHQEMGDDWTRYAVIDPGYQVCAVLFAAVPLTNDQVLLYDELYIIECDAATFAERMEGKCRGQSIQAFLIDPNMSIITELGAGKTVGQQYSDELNKRHVTSMATGSGFLPASDDVDAGILAVQGWLRAGENGLPRLRVVRGALPNFEFEISRYHRKRVAGRITDRPDERRWTHLMACLRYLALYDPHYVQPPKRKSVASAAVVAFRAKQDRARKAAGGSFVRLGPGRGKT